MPRGPGTSESVSPSTPRNPGIPATGAGMAEEARITEFTHDGATLVVEERGVPGGGDTFVLLPPAPTGARTLEG